VFDRPVIARCQLHKIRNVQDRLPEKLRSVVASRMRRAYHADSALAAEAELGALAAELDRTHPGAAVSLREGMTETLTVLRLGIPPTLARTLRSTNAIESMISICRTHASNVKRWRDGTMALRWWSPNLSVRPVMTRPSAQPNDHRAATEDPRNSGHPRFTPCRLLIAGQRDLRAASSGCVAPARPRLAVTPAVVLSTMDTYDAVDRVRLPALSAARLLV
jgi:hypothetical protein